MPRFEWVREHWLPVFWIHCGRRSRWRFRADFRLRSIVVKHRRRSDRGFVVGFIECKRPLPLPFQCGDEFVAYLVAGVDEERQLIRGDRRNACFQPLDDVLDELGFG